MALSEEDRLKKNAARARRYAKLAADPVRLAAHYAKRRAKYKEQSMLKGTWLSQRVARTQLLRDHIKALKLDAKFEKNKEKEHLKEKLKAERKEKRTAMAAVSLERKRARNRDYEKRRNRRNPEKQAAKAKRAYERVASDPVKWAFRLLRHKIDRRIRTMTDAQAAA